MKPQLGPGVTVIFEQTPERLNANVRGMEWFNNWRSNWFGWSLQPKDVSRRINNINEPKAEMSTMSENNWAVFRQDFHGNEFLVEQGLSESRARERVIEFESHKHHQHYWAAQIDSSAIDYVHLLRKQLANASTIESAIGVLINQGASKDQCIDALYQCRGIEAKDAMKLVGKLF